MKLKIKTSTSLRELILSNWGTSSVGAASILLGLLGNLTADDLQTVVDWLNTVMAQDDVVLRLGLILSGIGGLLSKDPRTPTPPPAVESGEKGVGSTVTTG